MRCPCGGDMTIHSPLTFLCDKCGAISVFNGLVTQPADPLSLLVEAVNERQEVNEGRADFVRHMIESLETATVRRLTRWEVDFLASIAEQFDNRGTLTDKQFARLEELYAEKTA